MTKNTGSIRTGMRAMEKWGRADTDASLRGGAEHDRGPLVVEHRGTRGRAGSRAGAGTTPAPPARCGCSTSSHRTRLPLRSLFQWLTVRPSASRKRTVTSRPGATDGQSMAASCSLGRRSHTTRPAPARPGPAPGEAATRWTGGPAPSSEADILSRYAGMGSVGRDQAPEARHGADLLPTAPPGRRGRRRPRPAPGRAPRCSARCRRWRRAAGHGAGGPGRRRAPRGGPRRGPRRPWSRPPTPARRRPVALPSDGGSRISGWGPGTGGSYHDPDGPLHHARDPSRGRGEGGGGASRCSTPSPRATTSSTGS